MHLHSGSLLQGGKYRIEKFLGQGGFGITYLATQVNLERYVAIKEFFFRDYCGRDADTSHVTLGTEANKELVGRFMKKFIKEAQTIARFEHPNIVKIIDTFTENNTAYYVMEYIDGCSLGDLVKQRGFLPQDEAIGYISQVGEALKYIHRRDVNHLDIKPGNILLRKEDQVVKVIDFGVAKQYDQETKEGTTTTPVGISHGYSPAEQYRKNGVQTFSPQSDVYALAATLFKLLTGQTPPEAMEVLDNGLPVEELQKVRVSEVVIEAIEHAMQSRRLRTQTVQEFLDELKEPVAKVKKEEVTEVVPVEEEKTVVVAEIAELAPSNSPKGESNNRRDVVDTPKPAPIPQPKPQPKPKPAPKPEPKPAPAPKLEPQPEPKPEPAPIPEPQPEPVYPPIQQPTQQPKNKSEKVPASLWIFLGMVVIGFIVLCLNVCKEKSVVESYNEYVAPDSTEVQENYAENQEIVTERGTGIYTGPVDEDGKPHGEGKMWYSDMTYEGTFNHGVAEGVFVKITFSNGTVYQGSVKEGNPDKGTMTYPDGSYVEGSFDKNCNPLPGSVMYNKNGKKIG